MSEKYISEHFKKPYDYKTILATTAKFLKKNTDFFTSENWKQEIIDIFDNNIKEYEKSTSSTEILSTNGIVLAEISNDLFDDDSNSRPASRSASGTDGFSFVPETQPNLDEISSDGFIQIHNDLASLPFERSQSPCIVNKSTNAKCPFVPIEGGHDFDDSSMEPEMSALIWEDSVNSNGKNVCNASTAISRYSITPEIDFDTSPKFTPSPKFNDNEQNIEISENNNIENKKEYAKISCSKDAGSSLFVSAQSQQPGFENNDHLVSPEHVADNSSNDDIAIKNTATCKSTKILRKSSENNNTSEELPPTQIFIPPSKNPLKFIDSPVSPSYKDTQKFIRPSPMKQNRANRSGIAVESCTQIFVPPGHSSNIYDVCTQKQPNGDPDVMIPEIDVYDACTQILNSPALKNDAYDAPTQKFSPIPQEQNSAGRKNRILTRSSSSSENEDKNIPKDTAKRSLKKIKQTSNMSQNQRPILQIEINTPQPNYFKFPDLDKIVEAEQDFLKERPKPKASWWFDNDSDTDEEATVHVSLDGIKKLTLLKSSKSHKNIEDIGKNTVEKDKVEKDKAEKGKVEKDTPHISKEVQGKSKSKVSQKKEDVPLEFSNRTRNQSKLYKNSEKPANGKNVRIPQTNIKDKKNTKKNEILPNNDVNEPMKESSKFLQKTKVEGTNQRPKRTIKNLFGENSDYIVDKPLKKRKETESNDQQQVVAQSTSYRKTKHQKPDEKPKEENEKQKAHENPKKEKIRETKQKKEHHINESVDNSLTSMQSNVSSSSSDISTSRLRRIQKPNLNVLFTKIDSKPYEPTITQLGGKVVTNPEDCTVLVTDKIYRTCKFLCAVAKGVTIVSSDWVHAIAHGKKFISPEKYILKDESSEKRFKFNLLKSIAKAQQNLILKNYSIYVTPSTKPTPTELNDIIFCAGGKCLLSNSMLPRDGDTIIAVSAKEDQYVWAKLRKAHPNIKIINTEGFMLTILQQKIVFDKYVL